VLRVDVRVERHALALDVALEVGPGEIVVISGPSGAGKSTIVRAIAGLLRPTAGTVRCGERTWFAPAGPGRRAVDLRPRDRRIGLVVQEGALLPHLSAWRNVAFAIDGLPRAERRAASIDRLDRLGLAARVDAKPAQLSGGERQRVALARALARRPAALVLDEPFSALDAATRSRAIDAVAAAVRDQRLPTVIVSHDAGDAERLGARTLALRDGRLGAPEPVQSSKDGA